MKKELEKEDLCCCCNTVHKDPATCQKCLEDVEQQIKEKFWNYLKQIQMKNIDEDKPFLDGYLCLSGKQCNDIEKSLEIT